LALRATGDNEKMCRASSINTNRMRVFGLALGNALVGLTGALLAQYQGYADLSSGTGMVMVGLACVIIGEVFGGWRSVTAGLICSVVGSVVYRLIIQCALSINLFDANALKLLSAVIVAVFMAIPSVQAAYKQYIERKQARAAMQALMLQAPGASATATAVDATASAENNLEAARPAAGSDTGGDAGTEAATSKNAPRNQEAGDRHGN
jgi:ABC-type uncharacterized transport system permease subunit